MTIEYNPTMEQMIRHSNTALRVQTAKAQQLEHALKEAEAQVTGLHQRLQTAEAQIARLYDVVDAKDAELAAAYAWAHLWKRAAKKNHSDLATALATLWIVKTMQPERYHAALVAAAAGETAAGTEAKHD